MGVKFPVGPNELNFRMQKIGTVESVWRYPVKSMAGEELEKVFVAYSGLIGDRVYAFVDETKNDNFPWMTARQAHELLLYKPRFIRNIDPAAEHPDMEDYRAEVTTPEGAVYAPDDPALERHLERRFGKPLKLRFSEKGMQDARPVSIFSTDTRQALEKETGMTLDPRRFRANLYVAWNNREAFFEDTLIGKTLQIGEKLTLMASKKDPRCTIITFDPDTAEQSPELLRHVALQHENCAGVYAVVLRESVVSRGDAILCG